MKYFIKTYGCQMNYSDSERIASVLEAAGYEKTLSEDNADLIVINACSVRQSAIDKILGRFKKYKKLRKINPNLKIVLTGCVLESDKKKFEKMFDLVVGIGEIEQLPNCHSELNCHSKPHCHSELVSESTKITDLIVPMSSKLSATEIGMDYSYKQKILKQVQNDNKQIRNDNNNYFQIKPLRQNKFSAYVPIMTGCNNFCSYCVVPYTRGREYSRPAEEIINEVRDLVEHGYKEIILLGQNVNSYESQFPTNLSSRAKRNAVERSRGICQRMKRVLQLFLLKNKHFAFTDSSTPFTRTSLTSVGMTKVVNFQKLLKLVNAIPGNFWIRFLTSHPKDMSEELIKTITECEKVTPYIHLALQSGDNEILKKMNRKYTAEHFLKLVKMIRKYLPDAAISTDIIIGFPGETEKQFQNTAEIMKKAKFDMAYINKYSPRPGTAAAKLSDDVSRTEKKRREKILTEILKKTALENNEKYVGKIIEVLIDKMEIKKLGNKEIGILFGKTETYKNVKIEIENWKLDNNKNSKRYDNTYYHSGSLKNLVGKFAKIKITQAGAWGLEGKITE